MSYTDTEIQDALRLSAPQPSRFQRPSGALQSEAEFDVLRAAVADALLLDSDGILYLLRLLKERIITQASEAWDAGNELYTLLGEVTPDAPEPKIPAGALDSLHGHLRALRVESGASAKQRRVSLFASEAQAFSKGLGVTRGGSLVRHPEEATVSGSALLDTFLSGVQATADLVAQVPTVLEDYSSASIQEKPLAAQTHRGEEIVSSVSALLSQSPKAAARSASLHLLTVSGLLKTRISTRDPLAEKYTGTMTPQVAEGKSLQLLLTAGVLAGLAPQVKVGDQVTFVGVSYSICRVQGDILWVKTPLEELTASTGTILPLGAVTYSSMVNSLEDAPLTSNLPKLRGSVARALSSDEGPGLAREQVAAILNQLVILQAALNLYSATTVSSVALALTSLRERRLDRAVDLLTGGQLEEFFTITSDGASYRSQAMTSIASAGQEFPPPEDIPADSIERSPSRPPTVGNLDTQRDSPIVFGTHPVYEEDDEVSY